MTDLSKMSLDELIQLMTNVRRELRESRKWFDTTRPDWDSYWSFIAYAVSLRGACARRKVGAAIISVDNILLGTGYNGRKAGVPNCLDIPCVGVGQFVGRKMNTCEADHAEINAWARCMTPDKAHTIYVTATPCEHCVTSLMDTPIQRIVYSDEHADLSFSQSKWTGAGRQWDYFRTR